ncbi:MAG: PepSY domain-containing protein [Pseudomonadota bacterium]
MKIHAAPALAPVGAMVVALCLVFAGVLASPADALTTHDRASLTQEGRDGDRSQIVQALSVLATGDRRPLRLAQSERPRVSLDDAVSKVRTRYQGRVIRAETRYAQDGRPTHYVKLLSPDGRVRTIRVDGRTGRIR